MNRSKDQYRFDERTKEEFKRDVRKSTEKENELIELWLNKVEEVTGQRPKCERTSKKGAKGEFLESKDVTVQADFSVDGYGLVEVKFSKPFITTSFHLKVGQIKKYIEQEACVLMVNGVDTDKPKFAIIRPRTLKKIVRECTIVIWRGFGNKKAYRIPVKKIRWTDL